MQNSDKMKPLPLKDLVQQALISHHTEKIFEELAAFFVKNYKFEKVYFTRKFKNRNEYIAGFGKDSIIPARIFNIDSIYSLFIQTTSDIPSDVEEKLLTITKFILYLINEEKERNENENRS